MSGRIGEVFGKNTTFGWGWDGVWLVMDTGIPTKSQTNSPSQHPLNLDFFQRTFSHFPSFLQNNFEMVSLFFQCQYPLKITAVFLK